MSSLQQQLDFKTKQLEQAKRKRQILEQEIKGTRAEVELLSKKMKDLSAENDGLNQHLHVIHQRRAKFESPEFKKWWNEIQSLLLTEKEEKEGNSSTQRAVSDEDIVSRVSYTLSHQLNHLLQISSSYPPPSSSTSKIKRNSVTTTMMMNDSFSSSISSSSFSRYYSPLLRETSQLLQEAQKLSLSLKQIQSGPLSVLEDRHRHLQNAIDETKLKMQKVSLAGEKQERLSLINRYKSDIPLLKQELALRPKAGQELTETRQRMIDQIQMLSSELNQVMEDLQVFEKRQELEEELENLLWEMKKSDEKEQDDDKNGKNDSSDSTRRTMNEQQRETPLLPSSTQILDALKVEVGTLQDQLSGLVEFAVEQKENISQWERIELPRHEDFVAHLEQERDQLRDEVKALNLEVPTTSLETEKNEDCCESNNAHGTREQQEQLNEDKTNELSMSLSQSPSSPMSPVNTSGSKSSSKTVQVVHFDGNSSSIEVARAPTKRWQRSAKFSTDNNAEDIMNLHQGVTGRYNLPTTSSLQLRETKDSSPDITQEMSLMSQTFKMFTDFYFPPLVEFVVKGEENVDKEKEKKNINTSASVASTGQEDKKSRERGQKLNCSLRK